VELLILTVAGVFPLRRTPARESSELRVAVIVPAHNEEDSIGNCVRNLLACAGSEPGSEIVVVADNCTDLTAGIAKEAGARVLVRADPARRGKGHALSFAFETLAADGFDAYIVIDADSQAESNLIEEFKYQFLGGAAAVQCRYGILKEKVPWRTRLVGVAFMSVNHLRPRGRHNLGLSAGIFGNGFGLRRETIKAVPYVTRSIVEDLEYHLKLSESGFRVSFTDHTAVYGSVPTGRKGFEAQRARWEGGRLRIARDFVPRLATNVLKGNFGSAEPLLDLLTLPLTLHVLLLVPVILFQPVWLSLYGAAALIVVALDIAASLIVGRAGLKDILALVAAPLYVAGKLSILRQIVGASKRDAEWKRSERS